MRFKIAEFARSSLGILPRNYREIYYCHYVNNRFATAKICHLKQLLLILSLATLALTACHRTPDIEVPVTRCADMPSPRASATAFAYADKGYVFGGRDSTGTLSNHLWQYDPAEDKWQDLGETPLKPRVNALAQAVGEYVYIGMGFNGHVYNDPSYLRDVWRYAPATGEWLRIADFPTTNTVRPVSYAMGDQLYVLYSSGPGFSRDIHRYDPASDTWTCLPDDYHRAKAGHGVFGATCQNRCFIGGGFNTTNLDQWWEADLTNGQWTKQRTIPDGARFLSGCTANSRYIYVLGGRYWGGALTSGHLYADILRFSPETNEWETCGTMPYGGAENMVAFTIGEHIYFGLGEDIDGHIHSQLYRIE